jgi:hypothetical protein
MKHSRDLIRMGRAAVDLYGEQIGASCKTGDVRGIFLRRGEQKRGQAAISGMMWFPTTP